MFQGLFKFVLGLIRLIFFLTIFVLIFHTWVIKQAVTLSLSYQLGADVSVRNVKMDWKNTGFEIQGLEIGNPYNFPRGTLADIPLVIVSVDLPGLSEGVLRLKTLGIDLRELRVMNVAQKGLNILDFKPLKKSAEESSASSRGELPSSLKKFAPELVIEELIFSIGDISYVDASGPVLKQNTYRAAIRGATYYDIRGIPDVITILIGEALKKMGFRYLESRIQKFQGRPGLSTSKKSGFFNKIMDALDGG